MPRAPQHWPATRPPSLAIAAVSPGTDHDQDLRPPATPADPDVIAEQVGITFSHVPIDHAFRSASSPTRVASTSPAPTLTLDAALGCTGGFGGAGGTNHHAGYRRWTLFTSSATASASVEDSSTTGKKYHPISPTPSSTLGSSAVAPAGGCVVPVICIAAVAVAQESAAASQRSWAKRAGGRRRKSLAMQVPRSAPMKWPPKRARGWENGASGAP